MKGLIFIPDISGFTNFVDSVNIDLGSSVTKDLLNEIISKNPLELELSEIEGDALLYYKTGSPLQLNKILEGVAEILSAFNEKFYQLKTIYNLRQDLSLKFILHYGDMDVCKISGFKHLYGKAVIESHTLLKNGCGKTTYILITDDYINALQQVMADIHVRDDFNFFSSDFSTELRKIKYYCFNYLPEFKNENYLTIA